MDNLGTFLGIFSAKIEVCISFQAELHGIMLAIKYANRKNWKNLCLETNTILISHVFSNVNIVSWHLLIKWKNILHTIHSLKFKIFHIFKEGNTYADRFSNAYFFVVVITLCMIHFLFVHFKVFLRVY